jgi:hypothetical protein
MIVFVVLAESLEVEDREGSAFRTAAEFVVPGVFTSRATAKRIAKRYEVNGYETDVVEVEVDKDYEAN